jgi:hypothetical protein
MRALIVTRQRTAPPFEAMPMLVEAFNQWRERYRSQMEEFSFFTSGNGGCGIVNVADEMELFQIAAQFPFSPFSTVQVEVLVEGDAALEFFTQMIQSQAAQMD